tara:strand:- start:201 stop:410 length:210 start_codon:yes stop_codon:yes gene_type:complete
MARLLLSGSKRLGTVSELASDRFTTISTERLAPPPRPANPAADAAAAGKQRHRQQGKGDGVGQQEHREA